MKQKSLLIVLSLLLVGCMAFGWVQNHSDAVGGAISLPKILWLNLAIASFLVIPAFVWWDERIHGSVRLLYGWFLAGFAVRAVIELPIIYFTHAWRCAYGISHDLVMMVLVIVLWRNARNRLRQNEATRVAGAFVPLLLVVLSCEMLNAWLFSQVADPQTGIYYANTSDTFRMINVVTWLEVATLYPVLGYWLKKWNEVAIHTA
jgi:hypothetical protein